MIGLDLNAVGNHEFDEGQPSWCACRREAATPPTAPRRRSLRRCRLPLPGRQRGVGPHRRDPVPRLRGAPVPQRGRGLHRHDSGGDPSIVTPSGVVGLVEFLDEADTVNALVPELRSRGIEAIVVLLHEGGVDRHLRPVPGHLGADRRHSPPHERCRRPGGQRPHPPGLRLRDWDAAAADCDRVDPSTIAIGGVPVVPTGTYRVTVNSFLADGGDSFSVLTSGTDRLGGPVDLDPRGLLRGQLARRPRSPGPHRPHRLTIPPTPESARLRACAGRAGHGLSLIHI